MSNNESKSSKVVSVRIPLPEYMEILQYVKDHNMYMTSYILKILYKYQNGKLVELKEGDEVYSRDRIEVLHDCMKLQNDDEEKLKNENKMLAKKCEQLEKDNHRLNVVNKALKMNIN